MRAFSETESRTVGSGEGVSAYRHTKKDKCKYAYRHSLSKNVDVPYGGIMLKCFYCGRWFKNKQALRAHLRFCQDRY
jgi:hypothetical protein